MKTTIYDLLGMIKDGKVPRKIVFKGNTYTYIFTANDYENVKLSNDWIFNDYVITDILNEEVTILETTITLKGVQKCSEANNKIEKIDIYDSYTSHNNLHTYINTYDKDGKIKRFVISAPQREIIMKMNEIIDRLENDK